MASLRSSSSSSLAAFPIYPSSRQFLSPSNAIAAPRRRRYGLIMPPRRAFVSIGPPSFRTPLFQPATCSTNSPSEVGREKRPSDTVSLAFSSQEPEVRTGIWNWRGYSVRYQSAGKTGPSLVLVHGFGANSDHWRKNIVVLAKFNRVYAIDLIGYGYSDKPSPREVGMSSFYTFDTWAEQLNEFCTDIVKDNVFFICNSIGGIVGLEAAIVQPQVCRGIVLLNISLRMLHIKKQPWFGRPFIKSFQTLLRNTSLGKFFYKSVATPEAVRSILCQPGLDPGAADVFLEFICYSDGPLPEELLPKVKCPVLIAWGDKDPWEPVELGKAYSEFDSVEDFVILPDVGHCPQDEAPDLVNPLVQSFVDRYTTYNL